jgi:hypothetical protein
VLIPFHADFSKAPIPIWELPPVADSAEATEPPWVLDDQPGEDASVNVTAEGPGGASSLVVDKLLPGAYTWKTQIWIPAVKTEAGAKYRASIWLKAERPSEVALALGRRREPYNPCGLSTSFSAPTSWKQFTAEFRAEGKGCGPEDNRLAIQVGRIAGKVWIANLSLTRE